MGRVYQTPEGRLQNRASIDELGTSQTWCQMNVVSVQIPKRFTPDESAGGLSAPDTPTYGTLTLTPV